MKAKRKQSNLKFYPIMDFFFKYLLGTAFWAMGLLVLDLMSIPSAVVRNTPLDFWGLLLVGIFWVLTLGVGLYTLEYLHKVEDQRKSKILNPDIIVTQSIDRDLWSFALCLTSIGVMLILLGLLISHTKFHMDLFIWLATVGTQITIGN